MNNLNLTPQDLTLLSELLQNELDSLECFGPGDYKRQKARLSKLQRKLLLLYNFTVKLQELKQKRLAKVIDPDLILDKHLLAQETPPEA